MAKWIVCKRCGHVFYNSLERCPECSKYIPNGKTIFFLISCVVVAVFLLSGVVFGIFTDSNDMEIKDSATSSAQTEKEEKSVSDNKFAQQGLGNLFSGTVEITVPLEFLEMSGEEFNYQLTEENKENGFTEIKKNDDGSATYTIKKKEYKKFISELREATKQGIDELNKDGAFPSVQSITYNNDLSKITITADKEKFQNSFDTAIMFGCGLTSCLYQAYDIDAKGECTVEVKDVTTGETIKSAVYPDAFRWEE